MKNYLTPSCLTAGLSISVLFWIGCSSKMETPTSYSVYGGPDRMFSMDYPTGWETDGGGRHGILWGKITKGSAAVKINSNLLGSIASDLSRAVASNFGTRRINDDIPEELAPETQVHEMMADQYEREFNRYEEEPAVTIETNLGRVRRGEFTAREGLAKIHGYRVTLLTSNTCITFIFKCGENNWEALQPAFDHMIKSISAYRGGN